MSEIRVKEGESLESALRRFKRSTARSGVLAEVRKREAYNCEDESVPVTGRLRQSPSGSAFFITIPPPRAAQLYI